jgi:hypothetical protein
MKIAGHVACNGGRREVHTGFWWGNPKEVDCCREKGIDVRIILKWILKQPGGMVWTGFIWLSTFRFHNTFTLIDQLKKS